MTANPAASSPADAASGNWVDRYAPDFAKPYLRLMRADRPIGTWLLLIPCFWGIALAAINHSVQLDTALRLAALFSVGAIVMRGAGCAYNDIVDREFDAKVARTALRPIPSGQVSVKAASIFLTALCLVGLAVLLQLNRASIILGVSSLGLIAAYPFMKRVTWWPQAWLGLTFNWGALLGYCAVAGKIDAPAISLYAAGIFWTLGYDTIYAHQDKEDDALIGVKSSALRLGKASGKAIAAFFAAATLLIAAAGYLASAPVLFYAALAAPVAHFTWQVRSLDIDNSAACLRLFKSNRDAGFLALAALLLAALHP